MFRKTECEMEKNKSLECLIFLFNKIRQNIKYWEIYYLKAHLKGTFKYPFVSAVKINSINIKINVLDLHFAEQHSPR